MATRAISVIGLPAWIFVSTCFAFSCAMKTGTELDNGAAKTPAAHADKKSAVASTGRKPQPKPQILPPPPKLNAAHKGDAKPAVPNYEAPTTEAAALPPAAPATVASHEVELKADAKADTKTASKSERVTRYVIAKALNIRTRPTPNGAIVGRLIRGSLLPVEIKGDWAKIGDAQYVQAKYLSASDPAAGYAAK